MKTYTVEQIRKEVENSVLTNSEKDSISVRVEDGESHITVYPFNFYTNKSDNVIQLSQSQISNVQNFLGELSKKYFYNNFDNVKVIIA
jgi:hypothetical protein